MTLDKLLAVPGGALSKAQLLGTITWFTVPDLAVSAAKLKRLWQSEGLDGAFLPEQRKANHVFQLACRSVETRRGGGKDSAEIKVDEVTDNPTETVYQVTRLLRDREQRVIEFPPSMRVVFTKATEKITFDPLDPAHYDALKHLTRAIEEHYEKNVNKVPGQQIRHSIRDYFKVLGATTMRRSGGVYFLPIEAADTLDSMERIIGALYGDASQFVMVPLANSEGAREIVEREHTLDVSGQADEMIADLTNILKRGTVRKDKMANVVQQRKELSTLKAKYEDILGGISQEIESKLGLLDEQLEKVMEVAYA